MFPIPLLLAAATAAAPVADAPIDCESCAEWNREQAPFRVFGGTYYVGVRGLSSVLIADKAGLVLLDGDLPQSAPLIEAHIRALGYRVEDLKLIVNSHAHSDHAGGIARLARDSGAQVVASPAGAKALRAGGPTSDDPQAGFEGRFPPVAKVREVKDGQTLRVGAIALTAHFTPGHTPGATTWTWRSCEGARCLDVVYADSLNAMAAPGFRFADGAGARLAASIDRVAALPCDVLLTVHPDFAQTFEKLARREGGESDAFVDRAACAAYADDARERLAQRLAEERAAARRD